VPLDELKAIIGYILAGLVAMVAWLGKREVRRLDDKQADHEARLRIIENFSSDIMKREDVLALYSEQREDNREKFKELREDHKDLRADLTGRIEKQDKKLDRILESMERIPKGND